MNLKEYRNNLRKLGMCIYCGKPNKRTPMWYCQECADQINANTNYKRNIRKKEGLCIRCGKGLDRKGIYCKKCAKQVVKSTKKSNKERRKEGYCHKCHTRRKIEGSSWCKVCKIKYLGCAN